MCNMIEKVKFKTIKNQYVRLQDVNCKPQQQWVKTNYDPPISNVVNKFKLAKCTNLNATLSAENNLGKILRNHKDRNQEQHK